jgi:hypothetical protein
MVLDGQQIWRICFDYAVTIGTEARDELRLETWFCIRDPQGTETPVEPEAPGANAVLVLRLLRQTVESTDIDPDGTVKLIFGAGFELSAPPHPDVEAWTLVSRGGELVVCRPGGGVSEWPARS